MPENHTSSNSVDMTAVMEILRQQSEANREMMVAAIAEMKKPSAEEQEKIDAEKAKSAALTLRRVEAARDEAETKQALQDGCSHLMPNGATRLRGQVCSDGFARVTCADCGLPPQAFIATDQEKTGGLNIHAWGSNAMKYVRQRVASSPKPTGIPKVPRGATIIFG